MAPTFWLFDLSEWAGRTTTATSPDVAATRRAAICVAASSMKVSMSSSTNAASRQAIFQDAAIPFLNRVFVSNDGATLLVSGEDADGKTAVWTLPSAGGTPVKIAEEGGSRLTVRAASGPSPDGERFVMFATTARGTVLTVEPLDPL